MATVKLPYLTSFEIIDYPLFKSDISWSFRDGINLLLGVNGVGKTTTIRALAFAIVGELALNKKSTYFRSRMPERRAGLIPKIQATFGVGSYEFSVTRRLDTLEFMKYSLSSPDGQYVTGSTEEEYKQLLFETTGVPTLFELDFLFKHLLIREEEAEATLWNAEDHSRVLRLLFNSGEFEHKYARLQKTVKEWAVRYSQVANTLTSTENALNAFRAKWNREQQSVTSIEAARLREERDQLLSDIERTQQDLDYVVPISAETRLALDEAYSEKIELEQHLDRVEDRLDHLEASYHHGLYVNYTPLRVALRKLEHHRVCMFCDRPVPEPIRRSLVESYSKEAECLFCHQPHEVQSLEMTSAPELDGLVTERRQVRAALAEVSARITAAKQNLDPITQRESQDRTKLLQLKQRLSVVERGLSELTGASPDWIETEESRLVASVDTLRQQATEARQALSRAQDEIAPLRETERETLARLADRFKAIFSRMVNQYLGEEGSVEVQIKFNPGDRSEYAVYTPHLNGKPRTSANEVSKSQAVLLDYAFRMTVLELYRELSGERTFFILETSEGVLDAAYVQRIGKLLGDFALDSGHLLLLVNNLSRADFLNYVFHRVPVENRLPSTLNFLRFGKLSKVQQDGEETYNRVGNDVFGPAFSAL